MVSISKRLDEKGIKVEVYFEEERIIPEEDGYLGEELRFKKGGPNQVSYFRLDCYVPKEKGIYGINVDGKKNVVLMKDRSRDPQVSLFSITIQLKGESYGILTTEYPQNNLRLLALKERGWFEIWEVATVSRDGLFFLTEQLTYEAQCFLDESGEIVCPHPQIKKWPQMIGILKPLVKKEELGPVAEYLPSPIPRFKGMPFKQGKVVWWNLAQGLGAIVIDEKGTQAKVHWKGLVLNHSGRLRALSPDQIVSYQRLVLPRQAKGRITGFLFEAVGVKPT